MNTNDEMVELYDQLRAGDSAAATAVWNGYYDQLVRVARRKLNGVARRAFDEEDVALSAIHSFLRGTQAGRFYRWRSSRELWRLLLTITTRKAFAQRQREMRDKRGGGKVRGDSVLQPYDGDRSRRVRLEKVHRADPSPEEQRILAEEAEQLLDCLGDESLERVARLRLAGYTNDEIANTLGCVRRTVERKLERIRKRWLAHQKRVGLSAFNAQCTKRRAPTRGEES
jgi:RNA polymerase sigma factor (sigma-70 family)